MILHALIDPSQKSIGLFSEIIAPVIPGYQKREQKEGSPAIHPYASIDGLAEAVSTLTGRGTLRKTRWIVSFPVARDLPVPSLPAWSTGYAGCQAYAPLVPFFTPVILCPFEIFPDLWLQRERLQQQYIFGDSLRYLFHLMRFSLDLVKRGRFKPVITRSGRRYAAQFEPVLTSEEKEWLIGYSDQIPPLCRYVFPRKTAGEVVCSPYTRVYASLVSIVQAIIAKALKENSSPIKTSEQVLEWETDELTLMNLLTGKITASGNGLRKEFAEEIRSWLSYTGRDQRFGRFFPCISMQEPSGGAEEPWIFRYHLRSEADPSLIIPAETIWEMKERNDGILPPSSYLKKELLSGLGKAGASSRLIRDGLAGSKPCTFECTLSEAAQFLTTDARILTDKGIDLILPLWWTANRPAPGIELSAMREGSETGSGLLGIAEMVRFDYRISLGGETVPHEEFKKAVALKMPFVRAGGKWISCDCPGMSRIIQNFQSRFLKRKPNAGDLIRISRTARCEEDVRITVVPEDEWAADLLSLAGDSGLSREIRVPPSFAGTLRPYQEEGYRFLVLCAERRFGACLADDMGLGKTPQALAWLLKIREEARITPVLVICPMSVVGNWEHEVRRFAPTIRYYIHHGSCRRRGKIFSGIIREYDLVITTYHLIARDIDEFTTITWSAIILDEAQNIKNPHANQTKAVKKLRSERRVALTGTPVENRLVELWSIMDFLNPGYLGGQKVFTDRYSALVEHAYDETATAELRRLISPFLLRRMKTDKTLIPDLPEKMEYKVYCSLTYEQVTLYQAVVDELAEKIDMVSGIARKGLILSGITRLKQICNHPGLIAKDASMRAERSGKVVRIIEMLEEVIDEEESALVFSQYAIFAEEMAEICRKHFSCPVLLLTGSTRREERDRLITEFQSGNTPSIFVISLKAGGTGLNLTAATHVFHIDRWWNPAVEDQATDRAFRIGQSKKVQVHLMISAGTIEEKIDEMNEKKRALAEEILARGDEFFTALSPDELIGIVSLRDSVFADEGEL
jgi:superfamily II DNA or RNA helicase